MNWAALERSLQPLLNPLWLQGWWVRRLRRVPQAVPAVAAAPGGLRRLYVDVSVVSRHDAGTGIQRIVRAVASRLVTEPPPGWEIVPVGATRKRPYHRVTWPLRTPGPAEEPIQARPGDVFLGLDFALDDVHLHRRQLAEFKRDGGRIWFVMYDLLPIQRPDWFSDKLVVRYGRWLAALAALADGFHCISPPVEAQLREQLARRYGVHEVATRILPMGWDVADARHGSGLPVGFDDWLRQLGTQSTVLMVGTLEPRKGHAEVLAAFELLWQQGADFNLVIVGRSGWKNTELEEALRNHPRRTSSVFWLEDASDDALARLYDACDGVIVASHAEGFGLPLIEALGHGKPVLARDLEVFRLHEHRGVRYFDPAIGPAELAATISDWLAADAEPVAASPQPLPSWAEAARFVVHTAEEEVA